MEITIKREQRQACLGLPSVSNLRGAKRFLLSLCMLIISLVQTSGQVEPGSHHLKLQLYLLIGQSNMAGRGVPEAQDTIAPERVLTLSKNLEWVPAKDPIHFDKSIAGTGLGRSFGIEMAKTDKDAVIGLIPCAVGGTPIDAWTPGAFDPTTRTHPWDDMAKRVQIARQYGEIKGILWHQGEGDCSPEKSAVYEEKLTGLIDRLRQLTGDPHTPFVCGELGRFFIVRLRKEGLKSGPADRVVEALRTVSRHDRFAAFVSSKGLTDKGDGTHFDSGSLRELGKRYARAVEKIQKRISAVAVPADQDTTVVSKAATFNGLMPDWKNPPKKYRPVQIIHHHIPEKANDVETYLKRAESRGLGGFVVNMDTKGDQGDPYSAYLTDKKSWEILKQFIRMATEKGFRIWLYDEKGYPSGSAGKWVYEGNPEFQVKGVICQSVCNRGGKGEMIPEEGELLSVVAVPSLSGGLEFSKRISLHKDSNERRVSWDLPEGDWKISAFIFKKLDWTTTGSGNWRDSSGNPYVDLLNPLVTQKFIRVTHQKYKEVLGPELMARVDAIFTDEPAFAVNGAGNIREKYPLIPWTNDLESGFYDKYGYSIIEQLPKLFFETIEPFQQERIDYWKLTASMFEDRYFKQIGDWCSENKIELTGHIFGEEALSRQMGTCGDMFGVLRQMQRPGVDRLYCTNTEDVTAEKTASSVAHLLGRNRVMSESGCHYEIQRWKKPFDIRDLINSGTHQYMLGINTMASYYRLNMFPDSEWAMYHQYMGRLGSMLTGGEHIAPVLVHIPMAGIWTNYQPKAERYWEYGPGFTSVRQTNKVIEIETQYGMLLRDLMDTQWDFDLIDDRGLQECVVTGDKEIFAGNEKYKTLVVFDVGYFEPETAACVEKIIQEGGKVIVVCTSPNSLSPVLEKYKSGIMIAENWSKVPGLLESSTEKDFRLKEDNPNIWYQHKRNADRDIYFICNRGMEEQKICIEINADGKLLKMDPLTGKIDELDLARSVSLEVPPGRGLFIVHIPMTS